MKNKTKFKCAKFCKVVFKQSVKLCEATSPSVESPHSCVCVFSRVHPAKQNEIYSQMIIGTGSRGITANGRPHPRGNTVCVVLVPVVIPQTLSALP